ncbi:ABC transporter permease [Microbacterium trichothecenolyticum]|uniref:ABC-2 type transport system permease protein n=1 Tax=Microbacterium trichothecenolyticum TaxID=69370 RepID=A0ABU0TX52_MICTR|nr:ABC transporter permease [Microbacterium trichothecenolyticum]MDQ1124238.1 ABC-2 type transport system permease protein [Microbacterium trichothecenolyticum]
MSAAVVLRPRVAPVDLVRIARLLPAQIALSQLVYWKDIAFALVGAVMPLALGLLPAALADADARIGAVPARAWLLAGGLSVAVVFVVYNVINSAARRREQRIYKRLRCAPVPAHAVLLGEAISASIPAVVQVAVIVVAGRLWLGVDWPANGPLLLVVVGVGLISLTMLAFGVSGLLPSGEVATWIVTPVLAALLYFSGAFGALPDNPVLTAVHPYIPSAEIVDTVRTAYLGHAVTGQTLGHEVGLTGGFATTWHALVLLLVWAAGGLMLFNSFFRWDPRSSR